MNILEKHEDEVREMWQSRVLKASAKTILQRVFLAAFAEAYPTALKILLQITFPGFIDISRPFLRGHATIYLSGWIVCDCVDEDGAVRKRAVYESESQLLSDARNLADKLKLSDKDRIETFDVLQKWIAADLRIGVNGERLVS